MKKLPPCSGQRRYNMLLFDTLCAVAPPSLGGLLGRTFIPPTISSQYSTQKERRAERERGRKEGRRTRQTRTRMAVTPSRGDFSTGQTGRHNSTRRPDLVRSASRTYSDRRVPSRRVALKVRREADRRDFLRRDDDGTLSLRRRRTRNTE